MRKRALFAALGLFSVCFPLAAQQATDSRGMQDSAAISAGTPLDRVSSLSLYWPKILSASNDSLLFHNGPVRAWSDGAQLANETALAQIGMAPLGLFPVAYLGPSNVAPVPMRNVRATSNSRSKNLASDGKDLPSELMDSPADRMYYTGEVGFVYGQWSGKGNGDYWQSYVWGQAGNDKFQINAGAAFENWSGNSPKIRGYSFSR